MSDLRVSRAGRRVNGAALDVLLEKPERREHDLALSQHKQILRGVEHFNDSLPRDRQIPCCRDEINAVPRHLHSHRIPQAPISHMGCGKDDYCAKHRLEVRLALN